MIFDQLKTYIKYLIAIVIVIIGICIYYFFFNINDEVKEQSKKDKEIVKIEKNQDKKEELFYYVDIKGAVKNPGVYKLKENSRVIDVINESGGLNENADTSILNLSKKIFDEMFIIIYTKDEINKYKNETISTKKINEKLEQEIIVIDENNSANIKSKQNTNSNKQKENVSETQKDDNNLININTASKEELLTITGIGESKADSIINYRKENGSFEKIEDIKNVSGIGDSLFEKIKDYITV